MLRRRVRLVGGMLRLLPVLILAMQCEFNSSITS